MARKRKLAAAVFSLGCLHASSVMALGLGDLELDSFLNEPLQASVDLLNLDGLHEDQIQIRLATSEDFAKLGVDRAYFLTTLKFDVVNDGSGRPRILVSSETPVLEPYLDFIVEARWPTGRLLREYTVLLDPPVYADAPVAVSASQRVYEEEGIPAPSEATEEADSSTATEESVGLFPDTSQQGAGSSRVKTTGTRVDVRESNLAPGAMPQRNFNSGAAAAPTAGGRYMISRDDTLWRIAEQAKPPGTSVHQEMLDIQRLNPDAFINGNINRIKAGYIIYLPTADDISSTDLPTALAEVQAQNAAWREGRDAELYASGGASLRISADEPGAEVAAAETSTVDAVASDTGDSSVGDQSPGATPGTAVGDVDAVPATGMESRLAEAEQELETLKRIVSLKDDQIAALQNALAEAGVNADAGVEALVEEMDEAESALAPGQADDAVGEVPLDTGEPDDSGFIDNEFPEADPADQQAELDEEPAPEVVPTPEETGAEAEQPEPPAMPKPAPAVSEDGGWMRNLLYLIGAAVLAGLAFVFVRRRREESDELDDIAAEPADDVFSDVHLKQQDIEVAAPADETTDAKSGRDTRGYGERKHDEYAADVDASDALAEADIYIAYGRHPQAIDLLNNALETEPGNPVYRLKLLEIYTELGNSGAATAQLEKIHDSGDTASIARAEAIVEQSASRAVAAGEPAASGSDQPPASLERGAGGEEALESDFSGLEIESAENGDTVENDLDLSGDFDRGDAEGEDDEELVIADDSNGLSTKLDLARAYLDMGDDDGARQILDEIVAEGNEELKAEAQALLDRIGG